MLDRLLVTRCKQGSRDALRRIYEKYRDSLLILAIALSHDVSLAEDVVHDVFVAFARNSASFELTGDSLKRPPRGFDPEHPFIEDLKRKDFIALAKLSQRAVTAPGFMKQFATVCKDGAPLVKFLAQAMGVAF